MIRHAPSACWKRTSAVTVVAGCLERLGHARADRFAIVGVEEVEDRPADDIWSRRPAEMTLRRGRQVGDAPFGVDQQQRVGAVLDERAEPLFAGAQRRFGLPPLLLFGVQRQRMADRALERFDRQVGLAEIVGGAGLHRLDRDFFGAAAGEHDDRRVDAALRGPRAAG